MRVVFWLLFLSFLGGQTVVKLMGVVQNIQGMKYKLMV